MKRLVALFLFKSAFSAKGRPDITFLIFWIGMIIIVFLIFLRWYRTS
jgi:hypothetical protein